ncbi:hypothetical protein B0J13DRAFT_535624 [Dactylonectria estremocensis]|uniref:Uncharacterized protein n=1 Tax=Dactylonectria estremocensis TaxID=1079267 RepID=A0A9P9JI51_9HYPO|nr:hypothetical protein B0J13DRAFT_535624 [Dactylonectria estremocensis]
METCSPTKRRALAPLDSNALGSPKTLFKDGKALGGPLGSPVKLSGDARKRMFEVDGAASPVGKKACLGRDEDASSRSDSPETSSLFDTSANDASWATTTTEPDSAPATAAAALERIPFTRPRALTREQAREKAEIIRLRLSLANYKVRTGQTSVPLADLQRRPMPRPDPRVVRVQSPRSSADARRQPRHEARDRPAPEELDRQSPPPAPEDDDTDSPPADVLPSFVLSRPQPDNTSGYPLDGPPSTAQSESS